MGLDLPEPIKAYVAAENGDDPQAFAQCFADDAVVRDEGRTFEGLAAIKQWKVKTKRKYRHSVEPIRSIRKDGAIVVTSRLTGSFPGSPVTVDFVFKLDRNKIASLEIR
jgi:hypothetical protein